MCLFPFNPTLTGGGQFDPPPLHEIRDCVATAADRDTPFHDFFLSSLTHLLIPSLRKSDHRSRGHATFCCVQDTWKLLLFLKCSKTVFILSFWPFAQFIIS